MAISGAKGLRARFGEFKRKRCAVIVRADVEIERGPNPASLFVVGVIGLAIAAGAFALAWRSSNEANDRAVPIQASVLGGVSYPYNGDVDVDVTFPFDGTTWSRRVRLHRTTAVPATLTLLVDPNDPRQSWLAGDEPPLRWGGLTPAVVTIGGIGAWMCLAMAWKLHKRRRRLGLENDCETRNCTVVADAVGETAEVPREFVVAQTTLGRPFDVLVILLAVMLTGFGVGWAVVSPRMAPFAVLYIALIVGSMVTALRWRRRRIVVTNDGLLVRSLFHERQFGWSDIAAATVVRRQPWRWVLGANRWELHRDYEMVRVEAVLTGLDGARLPTGAASRVSGSRSAEGPTPRNAAELLVGAWSQHTSAASPSDSFTWR